jgi:hypothetical protein
MTKNSAKINADNVIKTTIEHHSEEQKKKVNDITEFYKAIRLNSFTTSRGGKTV